jgi:hypothetical protein
MSSFLPLLVFERVNDLCWCLSRLFRACAKPSHKQDHRNTAGQANCEKTITNLSAGAMTNEWRKPKSSVVGVQSSYNAMLNTNCFVNPMQTLSFSWKNYKTRANRILFFFWNLIAFMTGATINQWFYFFKIFYFERYLFVNDLP